MVPCNTRICQLSAYYSASVLSSGAVYPPTECHIPLEICISHVDNLSEWQYPNNASLPKLKPVKHLMDAVEVLMFASTNGSVADNSKPGMN